MKNWQYADSYLLPKGDLLCQMYVWERQKSL